MDFVVSQDVAYIVKDVPYVWELGSTVNALGNIVHCVNSEFPGIDGTTPEDYINLAVEAILGNGCPQKEIWGLNLTQASAYSVQLFLQGETEIKLSPEYAEIWRIQHRTKSVEPLDWVNANYDQGLRVNDISDISDVFYGLIHYYAFHGLNLKKCEHCGRWFATNTFKKKYCSRNSLVPGYTHLNCEQAVRNIMQNCSRIKNRIDVKSRNAMRGSDVSYFFDFQKQCDFPYQKAKKFPSAENLMSYHTFLKEAEKAKGWLMPDSR